MPSALSPAVLLKIQSAVAPLAPSPPRAKRNLIAMIIEWYAFSGTRTRANCLEGNYDTLSPRMLDERLTKSIIYILVTNDDPSCLPVDFTLIFERFMIIVQVL